MWVLIPVVTPWARPVPPDHLPRVSLQLLAFPPTESSSTRRFAWHDTRSLSSQVQPFNTELCCKLHKVWQEISGVWPLTFDSVMAIKWYITLLLLFQRLRRVQLSGFSETFWNALQGTGCHCLALQGTWMWVGQDGEGPLSPPMCACSH